MKYTTRWAEEVWEALRCDLLWQLALAFKEEEHLGRWREEKIFPGLVAVWEE